MIYLILIIILLIPIIKNREHFNLGYGTSFSEYIPPQGCHPKNNCFKGSYVKYQIYQNMCQPLHTLLNRIKIPLKLDCIKKLV